VARVRTVIVALTGAAVVIVGARAARRFAVADRLPARRARTTRMIPGLLERRVGAALDAAALDVSVEHAIEYWAIGVVVAAILGAALGGAAAGVAGAVSAGTGAPIGLAAARGRRARLIAASVPTTIDVIASELRAGGTIATAVRGIARGDGVLAADFARIEARLVLGAPIADALRTWAREREAPGIDVAAGALAMCAAVGGRAADALDGVASSLRDRGAVVAEARALSAQARMSALVVGGTPFLYIGWSALADRQALHALFGTPTGRACIALGIGLETLGVWWMRRILRAGSLL
jgi:tight adherence protein B